MASPGHAAATPPAVSPPKPSPSQLPAKRRTSSLESKAGPAKRRKASTISQSSALAHPLRQTSFPPESASAYGRSPSLEAASAASGSAVSSNRKPAKKRGPKAKSAQGGEPAERTPSLVSGANGKGPAQATAGAGEREGDDEEEEDDDDKEFMALEDVVARTQEQKQEEIRLRAMLVEAFDSEQYNRYELWRAAKLSDAVVKRVVNATVSQSVPQMVSTAVKAVAKLFAGDIIEGARNVQGEWIAAGEQQSEFPTPPSSAADGDETEPEPRRGPLRPDHLREAWRRYKSSGDSRGVGVQQLWHAQQGDGVERFSTRTRTRLFR